MSIDLARTSLCLAVSMDVHVVLWVLVALMVLIVVLWCRTGWRGEGMSDTSKKAPLASVAVSVDS